MTPLPTRVCQSINVRPPSPRAMPCSHFTPPRRGATNLARIETAINLPPASTRQPLQRALTQRRRQPFFDEPQRIITRRCSVATLLSRYPFTPVEAEGGPTTMVPTPCQLPRSRRPTAHATQVFRPG